MKRAILISLACAVLIAFSCSNEKGGIISNLLKGEESGVPVTVESVVMRENVQKIAIPATIGPAESADVSVPEEAIVDRFLVSEGDSVAAGDAVAKLSEDEMNLRIVRLRADLRDAQSKLEKDSYLLRNRDRLLEEERIDQERYDKLESEVEADEGEIEKLNQDIARLEAALGDATLKSPVSGVVTKQYISAGAVAPAKSPILTISKVDPAIVEFQLTADMSTMVHPGLPVRVRFPTLDGRRAEGSITAVDSTLDSESSKFTVRASIPNALGVYKAGMRANVEFEGPTKQQVFVIPEAALVREGRSFFVFTVVNGAARRVQVLPKQTNGNYIEITRGLKEADMVVVRGHDKIKEGTKVDIWGR
ncbi:MAG: efflux RND transporter periplasmic adaptor subunit [Pseudomonadota bacterium]